MLILENIELALAGLRANKMRSFLTMLGILIGISSVIAIIMVGDAMNGSVMSSMGDLGVNNISVYITQKNYNELEEYKMKNRDYVQTEMLEKLKFQFQEEIEDIALKKSLGANKVVNKRRYANISMVGVNQGFMKSKNLTMLAGEKFQIKDQNDAKNIVLVSDKFVYNVFQEAPQKVLGRTIEIVKDGKYYSYTISGVYKYTNTGYEDVNIPKKEMRTDCYIPLQTALLQSREEEKYEEFDVIARKGVDTGKLAGNIQSFMNQSYYKDNEKIAISAESMEIMVKQMSGMMKSIQLAIAGIGAISLLVGGIGVMNIMIVSITERTREIGTRKALGATNQCIRLQFLVEAIVICMIGGFIGVILGIGIGEIVTKIMGYTGKISIGSIALCVLFSMVFGVFFGYYPANRAAKLNPIEALRYE
ncbi:MAG: ABC transporter permease [Lachnospiraceae bacterium]|nr:ABC transporter permease [Lachnospiraceae bacterium]